MVMEGVGAKGDGSKSNEKKNHAMNKAGVCYTVKNRLRALVVDSVRTCNAIEKAFLHAHGLQSIGVEHGYDALNLIEAGAFFDLIVIDHHMPRMQGAELIRRIRYLGIQSKIIGLSANGDEDRAEMMDAGADAFTVKPLRADVLLPILLELDRF